MITKPRAIGTVVVFGCVFLAEAALPNECLSDWAAMIYYDGFDLEAGTVHQPSPFFELPPEVDFQFGYNANEDAAFLWPEWGVMTAFLDGVPFGDVEFADMAGVTFVLDHLSDLLDFDDTVVIRTLDGHYFKVGHVVHDDGGVGFDYARLCPPPVLRQTEPAANNSMD